MYTRVTPTYAPYRAAVVLAACTALSLITACVGKVDDPATDSATVRNARDAVSLEGAQHYRLLPGESEVEIRVFRDGSLARLGHNHVIASTAIEGDLWLAEPVQDSVVDVVVEKASLVVDEPARRAAAGEEFDSEPPPDAIAGTRANMLGPALLDAARFPAVTLRTLQVEGELPALTLQAQIVVNDITRSLTLPLTVTLDGNRISATGKRTVSHAELGLEPFSVMLGALRVREEMVMYYSIVAEPSQG